MEYHEKDAKNRNEVVRIANEIITYLKENRDETVTIVWGTKDSIKFVKDLASRKYKPEKTDMELRKGIVNFLRGKFKLGDEL